MVSSRWSVVRSLVVSFPSFSFSVRTPNPQPSTLRSAATEDGSTLKHLAAGPWSPPRASRWRRCRSGTASGGSRALEAKRLRRTIRALDLPGGRLSATTSISRLGAGGRPLLESPLIMTDRNLQHAGQRLRAIRDAAGRLLAELRNQAPRPRSLTTDHCSRITDHWLCPLPALGPMRLHFRFQLSTFQLFPTAPRHSSPATA